MATSALLFEIGCEELPASFVDGALAALPDLARAKLAELRLTHGEVQAHGTPRRLALIVHELADAQADVDEQVIGPPENAAYKDGKPTKAAEAFAQKLGVEVSALGVIEIAAQQGKKAGRYVAGRKREKGRPARELLGKALEEIAAKIPFRKSMRWGSGDTAFGRPIQWLVALYGQETISVQYAGISSGRSSRGHRFLSPKQFDVRDALSYVDQLRAAHVLVDRKERERVMMERVAAAAKNAGGEHDPDPFLVRENASLVEEPHAVIGHFEEAFLALPSEVIRAVARGHQRYFVIQRQDGSLLPAYITVVNTANAPDKIAKGNDGVMRARLSDGRFFYEEDKKTDAEKRVEKLAGIVFHARLGSVREKVTRMEALSQHLAKTLGVSSEEATRAAHLAKNDLVSLMVGEFPELQGIMGREYARAAKMPEAIADAIRDHYAPIGADGPIAPTDLSRIVATSDRVDSLVGCFAVGLQPSGTADPYALRRACIGILRTMLESEDKWDAVDLPALLGASYDLYAGKKLDLDRAKTIEKVLEFASERLRGILASRTTNHVADAVLSGDSSAAKPRAALAKALALHEVVKEGATWLERARTVAKRLSGISKEHAPSLHPESAFTKKTDADIVSVVRDLDAKTKSLSTPHHVREALYSMADVAERIDKIFLETLVNDPEDKTTPKRLELLSYGARCMLRIADFTRLQ